MNKVMVAVTVDGVVLVVGVIDLGLGLVLYREEPNNTGKVEITINTWHRCNTNNMDDMFNRY